MVIPLAFGEDKIPQNTQEAVDHCDTLLGESVGWKIGFHDGKCQGVYYNEKNSVWNKTAICCYYKKNVNIDYSSLELVNSSPISDTYYNSTSGVYYLKISPNIINYYNGSGYEKINKEIGNIDISIGSEIYNFGMEKGTYKAYFKEKSDLGSLTNPVRIVYGNYNLVLDPDSLNFIGQSNANKEPSEIQVKGNEANYAGQFGKGLDLKYSYLNTKLKEELIINSLQELKDKIKSNPDDDDILQLGFTVRAYNFNSGKELDLKVGNKIFNSTDELSDSSTEEEIEFLDDNKTQFYFSQPFAYDSKESKIELNYTYSISKSGDLIVKINIPYSWLETASYPIIIDPTTTISGANSYSRGCWREVDSGDNIVDYDCLTETGGTDEIRVGWRGYNAQSGYAGEMHKSFVGFNISSISSLWAIDSMTFNYYDDYEADPSTDTLVFEEFSQTDFENGFSNPDLTPDSYSESQMTWDGIRARNQYISDSSPYENSWNSEELNINYAALRLGADLVNGRYFYVGIRGTSTGLYDDYYYVDIDDEDSSHPPELIISYTTPDTTAPTTSASATSPPGGLSYTFGIVTNDSVQVTLSCGDSGGSGCKSSYPKYCLDNSNSCSPLITYPSPITISTGGISYIRYNSKDNANNTEVVKSKTIIIDREYTQNVSVIINDAEIWNYTNYFVSTETTGDFSQELNNALDTCTEDAEGYCNIPIIIHSYTTGKINVSNINIYFNITEYIWNISSLVELPTYKVRVLATDGLLNSSWDESDEDFSIGGIPNDTSKFFIKNDSNETIAWFGNFGNIVLRGTCNVLSNCLASSENLFVITNSSAPDEPVAYVNSTGDLCIEKGSCSSSASCNEKNAFKIRNSTQELVSYIDFNGELCFTGGLYENANL